MKLVEQELWQREEKGLIGILPVRDTAETTTVGTVLSQGNFNSLNCFYFYFFILFYAVDECLYLIKSLKEYNLEMV